MKDAPLVGVLALQGGFPVHAAALREVGAAVREVRVPADLEGLWGIVLPGGESTVQSMLIDRNGLRDPLVGFCQRHPVMATCAGLILLSREAHDSRVKTLGLLDLEIERNGYGSQRESFTEMLDVTFPGQASVTVPGIFIRAPRIRGLGADVTVLGQRKGEPIAVLQKRIMALTFHPELGRDRTFHRYFLSL